MGSSKIRNEKSVRIDEAGIDVCIERIRKARALLCDPSYLGIDKYVHKRNWRSCASPGNA